jgi:hypothetical protein
MIKRLDLILNGKDGVGKIIDYLLQHRGQPLITAVGRLVLCRPFLATAAVWLDSAARRCELRLRFCVRKTCPALGTKQLSISVVNHHGKSFGTIASQVDAAADNESEEKSSQEQTQSNKAQRAQKAALNV